MCLPGGVSSPTDTINMPLWAAGAAKKKQCLSVHLVFQEHPLSVTASVSSLKEKLLPSFFRMYWNLLINAPWLTTIYVPPRPSGVISCHLASTSDGRAPGPLLSSFSCRSFIGIGPLPFWVTTYPEPTFSVWITNWSLTELVGPADRKHLKSASSAIAWLHTRTPIKPQKSLFIMTPNQFREPTTGLLRWISSTGPDPLPRIHSRS